MRMALIFPFLLIGSMMVLGGRGPSLSLAIVLVVVMLIAGVRVFNTHSIPRVNVVRFMLGLPAFWLAHYTFYPIFSIGC